MVTYNQSLQTQQFDPHDFEPTTQTAKDVAKGQIILSNGLGYDSWMQKLVEANNQKGVTDLRVGEDIMKKQDGDNEHLWYNKKTVPKLANRLAALYAKRDPKHKAAYHKNAQRYIKSLATLDNKITTIRQHSNGEKVDVSEPVFDYALAETGYKVNNTHFAKSVEDGTDPSPADIKAMQADIKGHKIAFFVENTQANDKIINNLIKLAKDNNVPVLKVTETLPKGLTYKEWMLKQYNQLETIQKGLNNDRSNSTRK